MNSEIKHQIEVAAKAFATLGQRYMHLHAGDEVMDVAIEMADEEPYRLDVQDNKESTLTVSLVVHGTSVSVFGYRGPLSDG